MSRSRLANVWALSLSRNATVSRSGPSLTYKNFLSHTIFSSSARRHCRWLWQPCITTLFLTSCFVSRIRKDDWSSRNITTTWMVMLRQLSRKGMWKDLLTVTCRIHIFFQPGLLIVFTLKHWNWPALLKWPLGNGFGLTWKNNHIHEFLRYVEHLEVARGIFLYLRRLSIFI